VLFECFGVVNTKWQEKSIIVNNYHILNIYIYIYKSKNTDLDST